MDLRKTKTFRTRLLRALEITRIPQMEIERIKVVSTPLYNEPQNLLECSPLFPFALRLQGELKGFYFFTSSERKIPFTQEEVGVILKQYYTLIMQKLENQTNLMINVSTVNTPKDEVLPSLIRPLRNDDNMFSLKQNITLSNQNQDILEIVTFLLIGHKTQTYRDI